LELWGPSNDNDAVHSALLEAGEQHGMIQVSGRAYHTNALESAELPRPLRAIYSGETMKPYREWLTESAYETTAPLGGSFYSENTEGYYFTPYELDYGRTIGFDHDFIGREALERMVAEGKTERRKKVTFVWNGDDSAAAYGSMLHDGPLASSSTCQCRCTNVTCGPPRGGRQGRRAVHLDRLLGEPAPNPDPRHQRRRPR
jgi:syringate O-demethylase